MKSWNDVYYGKLCNWGQTPDVNKIIAAEHKKYSRAKSDKEYAEYVYNLAFEDYVDTIRTSPYVWRYRLSMILDAISEMHSKGRKPHLHMVEDWITEDFFDEEHKIKIKEIRSEGLGTSYAYNLYFEINHVKFELKIPVRDTLTTENIEYAFYGEYALLYEESESCWNLICMDYTEDGMKDKIKQYFEQGAEP